MRAIPTIVVGRENNSTCTLVKNLPRAWTSDENVRYVVIPSAKPLITDGKSDNCFDLHVSASVLPDDKDIGVVKSQGIDTTYIYFTRHTKTNQHLALNRLFSKLTHHPEFWPLRTWDALEDIPMHRQGVFVLRPEAGARGIGQLVFDNRITSSESINRAFQELESNRRAQPERIHDGETNKVQPVSLEKQLNTALLERLEFNDRIRIHFAKLHGSPVWYSDGDSEPGEGWQRLYSGCFVQEYVPDIAAEFRVLIGGDNLPVYVIRRDRPTYASCSGIDLASASSAKVGIGEAYTTLQAAGLPQAVVDGFTALREVFKKDFSLYSFDVFITASGKWGIFEFSNEFGSESIPNGLIVSESQRFIERMARTTAEL